MIKVCYDITDNEIFLRSTDNDSIIQLSTFVARELSDFLMLCYETNGCPCSIIAVGGVQLKSDSKTSVVVSDYRLDREFVISDWQWKSLAVALNMALLTQR